MDDILGNPDPDDPSLDTWVTGTLHCTSCGRALYVVMTEFHWETQTGEIFQDQRCSACKALDEMSAN